MCEHAQEECYAHISEDGTRTQTVLEHLQNTAALAARFAEPFGGENQAYIAGFLHDIGKYSKAFQRRLKGSSERVDHSTAGAIEAFAMRQPEIAFAVAGHHGGLPDGGSRYDVPDSATLLGRIRRKVEPYDRWRDEVDLSPVSSKNNLRNDSFKQAFYTRMLYSCLVDADYLDTETFMNGAPALRGGYETLPQLLEKLNAYVEPWWDAKTELNRHRCNILRACMEKGCTESKGLYTLTVPTGGGKTVSSLAFALSMACAQNIDRVIYVIPYTSIIDQTADVFSKILGEENVLEHHSGVNYTIQENSSSMECRKALATDNWDAPVVVTTAVQFFESLFANRSSRCRKLHNIANSVIVFDEAQTMPVPYLRPCVAAIAQLVQYYSASAVLCTATQPALEALFKDLAPSLHMQEICPKPEDEYNFFRRTTLQNLGEISQSELAEQLNGRLQVLCVVNRRKSAQELFHSLQKEGSYCLTTLLYPAHRKRLLQEIKTRLKEGKLCRVVSTSLIEAGVDVDFPAAYRELAGLDSILQTAGRCNREGKRAADESFVSIFRFAQQRELPMLKQNISSAKEVLRDYDDPSGLDAIQQYFTFYRKLAGEEALDKEEIMDNFRSGIKGCMFPFAAVAEKFHLIESPARIVYIPLEKGADLIDELRRGARSRKLFRELGQYGVSVYPDHLQALDQAGLLEWLDKEIVVLTDVRFYDSHTGLAMDIETGNGWFI